VDSDRAARRPLQLRDGARLWWRSDGDAAKPALLLGNSLGTDLTLWDPVLPQLIERFQVMRFDMRGHGASDAPPGDYTIEALARDALAVADAAGAARFSFAGISIGAVNAALINLTKALADRGVRDGVRVNAINPGAIATERLQVRLRALAAEHHVDMAGAGREMARAFGIARFGQPDEIARLVAFLASPQAAFCHGSIVDADGGQTRTL